MKPFVYADGQTLVMVQPLSTGGLKIATREQHTYHTTWGPPLHFAENTYTAEDGTAVRVTHDCTGGGYAVFLRYPGRDAFRECLEVFDADV